MLIRCYCIEMADVVKTGTPRTRRAEKAEQTRQQILRAAANLFGPNGYAPTTIEAIAAAADVAVETVYARFGNKLNLLKEILDQSIVNNARGVDILALPEVVTIRELTDQRTQIAHLAHLSRGILERSATAHRILRSAVTVDPAAADFERSDFERRRRTQAGYIDILLANGPLPTGLNAQDAAITYGTLANPDNYAVLTTRRGLTPDQYENWLRTCLTLLFIGAQVQSQTPPASPQGNPPEVARSEGT